MNNDNKQQFALSWRWVAVTVFLGVLGCAIWTFLDNLILPSAISLIHSTSSHFADHLYRLASDGLHEYSSMIINTSFQFFICALSVIGGVFTFSNARRLRLEARLVRKRLSSNTTSELTPSELTNDDLEKELDEVYKAAKRTFYRSVAFLALYCVCACSVLVSVLLVDLSTTIAAETLHNIDIIAPYVSDNQYKLFISDFYQMSSKDDYDALTSSLLDIAKQNGLSLKQ